MDLVVGTRFIIQDMLQIPLILVKLGHHCITLKKPCNEEHNLCNEVKVSYNLTSPENSVKLESLELLALPLKKPCNEERNLCNEVKVSCNIFSPGDTLYKMPFATTSIVILKVLCLKYVFTLSLAPCFLGIFKFAVTLRRSAISCFEDKL